GAQLRAARRAAPQVKPERLGRTVCNLTVSHLGERTGQLLAAAALLDVGEDLQEPLPALRHTPVDLCIRPACDLPDLGVGVALRLEGECSDLLRLERLQRLRASRDSLPAGGTVVGPWTLRGDRLERVSVDVLVESGCSWRPEESLSLAAHRQRLPLGHGLHPADERVTLDRRRLGEQ